MVDVATWFCRWCWSPQEYERIIAPFCPRCRALMRDGDWTTTPWLTEKDRDFLRVQKIAVDDVPVT